MAVNFSYWVEHCETFLLAAEHFSQCVQKGAINPNYDEVVQKVLIALDSLVTRPFVVDSREANPIEYGPEDADVRDIRPRKDDEDRTPRRRVKLSEAGVEIAFEIMSHYRVCCPDRWDDTCEALLERHSEARGKVERSLPAGDATQLRLF